MDGMRATGLTGTVERLLDRRVEDLADVTRRALDYDAFLPHREVTRITGTALVGDRRLPWSLIEKRTEGPALASPYLLDNARRELDAYSSGILADLGPGLRAPRLWWSEVDSTGAITVRIEEIAHTAARPLGADDLIAAARDLGGLAGTWLHRSHELQLPWLFRGWIDRHAQPEAVDAGLQAVRSPAPPAAALLGDRLREAERLILGQARVTALLAGLPQTLCHHDAVGANVFRDSGGTVLIDWESVGPGAVGADLASLLFSSVRRGDASADEVRAVQDDAIDAYADGIRHAGGSLDTAVIRRGIDASASLRWKLAADIVTSMTAGEVPRRGSRPDEPAGEAERDLLILLDLILDGARRTLD